MERYRTGEAYPIPPEHFSESLLSWGPRKHAGGLPGFDYTPFRKLTSVHETESLAQIRMGVT
jgi:hypothetical protein